MPADPVGGQHGGGHQAEQAGQRHRGRWPEALRHRAGGQQAGHLGGEQPGLRDRERRAFSVPGRARMKAAAAASWYAPPAPASVQSSATTGAGGCTWQKISGAQDSMASQPIGRSRSAGRISRPSTNAPISRPAGGAASSRPTVGAPPPSVCAYGAASPSGTTVKPASQPNSTRTRSAGVPKIVVRPARVISWVGRVSGLSGGVRAGPAPSRPGCPPTG